MELFLSDITKDLLLDVHIITFQEIFENKHIYECNKLITKDI